jgi:hypothetical protein
MKDSIVTMTVNDKDFRYTVSEFSTDWEGRGFHYRKLDNNEEQYDVFICDHDPSNDICDCADATFRERRCKHMDAIRAILVAAQLNGGKDK